MTDIIINLVEKKEKVNEELAEEMRKVQVDEIGSMDKAQADLDKLMEKLLDPNLIWDANEDEDRKSSSFTSPLLWELMNSHALMHLKSYFEKSLLGSVMVQENPKIFVALMNNRDLRSFPR